MRCHAEGQLGLLDHLGVKIFLVMVFCIGKPADLEPADDRAQLHRRRGIGAAQRLSPGAAGSLLSDQQRQVGPGALQARSSITMDMVDKYLKKMYLPNPDFVFS